MSFADPTRRRRWWMRYLGRARGMRVLLVRGDPYLALLLRMQLPGCEVVQADDDESALHRVDEDFGLIVTPARQDSALLEQLLARAERPPVVGLVDTDGARMKPPAGLDQVLLRPFVPGELHQAVRRALGLPDPKPPRFLFPIVRRIVAGARLGTVALAAVFMVNERLPSWRAGVLAFAFLYATLRLPALRWRRLLAALDAIVAAMVVTITGGQDSVFLAFGLAVVVGVGINMGPRGGLAGGGAVSLAAFPNVAIDVMHNVLTPTTAIIFLILFPLMGLTSGYARRTLVGEDPLGSSVFAEANRMLSALYRMTRTMPGGLEVSTVARTAAQELAETLGARAGVVLVEEGGVLSPTAAFGVESVEALAVHPDEGPLGVAVERGTVAVVDTTSLVPGHADVLRAYPRWFIAPIRRSGAVLGALLAAEPSQNEAAARATMQRLATESAVALENARLFARVRGLTVDEERRRVARELHDGVAQALTHVRLELDFLARRAPAEEGPIRDELERLSRVVQRAGDDVRTTIIGLRSGVSIGRRLVPAVEAYLNDLRGLAGPDLVLQASADPLLAEETAGECFRIVQEAVSNALRHAECSRIDVRIDAKDDEMLLEVEDDGTGIVTEGGSGFGLEGMKERAARMGATLEVASRPGVGALIRLAVPREVEP
jgi:signal transduction histidine kinase